MASIEVTITGILYDRLNRTAQNVVLIGEASYSGLGVGGGPMPGQPPLGVWGPPQMPPGFWGGGMGPGVKPQPHPEHPIVLPPDVPPIPTDPPPDGADKPPPENGGGGFVAEWSQWGYFPGSTEAQPK